jgi:hypothetical protein
MCELLWTDPQVSFETTLDLLFGQALKMTFSRLPLAEDRANVESVWDSVQTCQRDGQRRTA